MAIKKSIKFDYNEEEEEGEDKVQPVFKINKNQSKQRILLVDTQVEVPIIDLNPYSKEALLLLKQEQNNINFKSKLKLDRNEESYSAVEDEKQDLSYLDSSIPTIDQISNIKKQRLRNQLESKTSVSESTFISLVDKKKPIDSDLEEENNVISLNNRKKDDEDEDSNDRDSDGDEEAFEDHNATQLKFGNAVETEEKKRKVQFNLNFHDK